MKDQLNDEIKAYGDSIHFTTQLIKFQAYFGEVFTMEKGLFHTLFNTDTACFELVSPSLFRALGYTHREICGAPITELVVEEDVDKTNEIINASGVSGERVSRFVNRYKKKGGGYITIEWLDSAAIKRNIIWATARAID